MFSPSPAWLFFLAVLAWITVIELSVPLSHPPLSAFLPPPLYFRPELGGCEQWPPLHPVFDWPSVTLPRPAGAESCLAEVDWNCPAADDRINACLEHDRVKRVVPSFHPMLWKTLPVDLAVNLTWSHRLHLVYEATVWRVSYFLQGKSQHVLTPFSININSP